MRRSSGGPSGGRTRRRRPIGVMTTWSARPSSSAGPDTAGPVRAARIGHDPGARHELPGRPAPADEGIDPLVDVGPARGEDEHDRDAGLPGVAGGEGDGVAVGRRRAPRPAGRSPTDHHRGPAVPVVDAGLEGPVHRRTEGDSSGRHHPFDHVRPPCRYPPRAEARGEIPRDDVENAGSAPSQGCSRPAGPRHTRRTPWPSTCCSSTTEARRRP